MKDRINIIQETVGLVIDVYVREDYDYTVHHIKKYGTIPEGIETVEEAIKHIQRIGVSGDLSEIELELAAKIIMLEISLIEQFIFEEVEENESAE